MLSFKQTAGIELWIKKNGINSITGTCSPNIYYLELSIISHGLKRKERVGNTTLNYIKYYSLKITQKTQVETLKIVIYLHIIHIIYILIYFTYL